MTSDPSNIPLPALDGWALILGASSGFGAATSLALARAGVDIIGVHLDRRATLPNVERLTAEIRALGREAWFFNVNAADDDKRAEVLAEVSRRFAERGRGEQVRVLLHSIAFGTLRDLVISPPDEVVTRKQMDMTIDVMANSLVYWAQGLVHGELLSNQGRIFAMTSNGSSQVWRRYGVVSAAKAALEAHIRQLAFELGPRGITANSICAGVTDTPAIRKIPDNEAIIEVAIRKNPWHRLTRPEDVANAIVALAQPCTYWLNGDVLYVDGGEAHSG
ncbi:MAG: SDR family oxidoreductase [Sorangiineae bacterium]|nr:SDR family oxidoreductase [Polyangiaceae bacterium]MEB2324825.1 SDR family oxidoreductase [Sorangiineae bacterium]